MAAMSLCGFSRDVRTSLHSRQTAHFSRSWLAMLRTLRFTSLDKRPARRLCDASGGGYGPLYFARRDIPVADPTMMVVGPGAWDLFFRK
jgi:hypothetical protein